MSRTVLWTDVGPRDGLQNLPDAVPAEVKVRLVRGLLDAGAPRVEATSFVSPRWVPQLADAAEVLAALGADAMPRLRVLIPNLRGLELALEQGAGNVLVTIGATDSFNRRNVNRSIAESLDGIDDIVGIAGRHGVVVDVAVSVAFGCPFEGAVDPQRVIDLARTLVERGVAEVGIADTIGVADPGQVGDMVQRVAAAIPLEQVSVHFHDTRGMGVANVVAAYQAGVSRFEGSVGGLGGCPFAPRSTGNVASEDSLQALQRLGAGVLVDLDAYCAVAERLGADLGMALPGKLHRAGVWHPELITKQEEVNA
ncbi:MAG TPA: hydroxymethylglutaryl-CoA lyase [Candidatus Dormibacteraeota bacterium]|jgi:hydroxymethylglutaryl-CoA lyase|nr:hydroxymethylglutaryl-CoA lyase [Candidatus Dormibacteraeota bacterium]